MLEDFYTVLQGRESTDFVLLSESGLGGSVNSKFGRFGNNNLFNLIVSTISSNCEHTLGNDSLRFFVMQLLSGRLVRVLYL